MNLVGDESMGLAVNPFGDFLVRRLDQAENSAARFVEPVLFILDAIFAWV